MLRNICDFFICVKYFPLKYFSYHFVPCSCNIPILHSMSSSPQTENLVSLSMAPRNKLELCLPIQYTLDLAFFWVLKMVLWTLNSWVLSLWRWLWERQWLSVLKTNELGVKQMVTGIMEWCYNMMSTLQKTSKCTYISECYWIRLFEKHCSSTSLSIQGHYVCLLAPISLLGLGQPSTITFLTPLDP